MSLESATSILLACLIAPKTRFWQRARSAPENSLGKDSMMRSTRSRRSSHWATSRTAVGQAERGADGRLEDGIGERMGQGGPTQALFPDTPGGSEPAILGIR